MTNIFDSIKLRDIYAKNQNIVRLNQFYDRKKNIIVITEGTITRIKFDIVKLNKSF